MAQDGWGQAADLGWCCALVIAEQVCCRTTVSAAACLALAALSTHRPPVYSDNDVRVKHKGTDIRICYGQHARSNVVLTWLAGGIRSMLAHSGSSPVCCDAIGPIHGSRECNCQWRLLSCNSYTVTDITAPRWCATST